MARKPRIHFPGAFYHVILRGNDRQAIFFQDGDRLLWQSILVTAVTRYAASIHCYCWMTNHIHMIVQVSDIPLGATVRYAASQYARKINLREQRTGHLFERRHQALLVTEDGYLQGLVRYIHNNPVRAGLAECVDDYPWTSHGVYTGHVANNWLTTRTVLRAFGRTRRTARQGYLAFMRDAADQPLSPGLDNGAAQDELLDHAAPGIVRSEISQVEGVPPTLEAIIQQHLARSGLSEAQLTGPSRARALAKVRTNIAVAALDQGVATVAEIARRLHRSESAISQAVSARQQRRRRIT